jgi:RNA polymerase sigma factor (sigma-70 family)
MPEKSDAQLLQDYAHKRDEGAFRTLVTRHTDLVYSAALRQVSSSDLAADVAQSVFVDLARKAGVLCQKLSANASLVGWLYRSTRFAALNQIRDSNRRVVRERHAMEQFLTPSGNEPDWNVIQPLLDEAMSELNDDERDTLLLRYFKNHDFRTVGTALGISDDAAQKRVSRAIERLRELLGKRGVATGVTGLIALVSTHGIIAAPAGLAVTISAGVTSLAVVSAATTVTTSIMNLKAAAFIVVSAAVAGTTTYMVQQQRTEGLKTENQQLIAQIQALQNERDTALASATAHTKELESLQKQTHDLLRLRNEVATLRQKTNDIVHLQSEDRQLAAARESFRRESEKLREEDLARKRCINHLWELDGATQQWAMEKGKSRSDQVIAEEVAQYLREFPKCPRGGSYKLNVINVPTCSIPDHKLPTQAGEF